MKSVIMTTIGCFSLLTAFAQAEEEKVITFKALPTQVQQAVLKYTKEANIKKVEHIQDEDVIKYEIESMTDGRGMDITFAENGEILEVEKTMALSNLPAAARAEIKKDYPTMIIQNVESVQRFYYDVEGTVDGKKIQFKVLATGDIEDEDTEEKKDRHEQ